MKADIDELERLMGQATVAAGNGEYCKTDRFRLKLHNSCAAIIAEIRAGRLAERRYEFVRKLNPRSFAELYERNIRGEGQFDYLVDNAMKPAEYDAVTKQCST